MSFPKLTLQTLDAYLASDQSRHQFPPAIEAAYQEEVARSRLVRMHNGVLQIAFFYNLFLFVDFALLPHTATVATALHFLLVTPTIFIVDWFYGKTSSHRLRQMVSALIPIMILLQIMWIFALNRGEAADHYQYLAIMVIIFCNVNQRPGFHIALSSTLIMTLIYLTVLLPDPASEDAKFIGTVLVLIASYLSLRANWRMEQDVRLIFLARLREQLRYEGAASVAKRDVLTGIYNRRKLDELIPVIWHDGPDQSPIAIVMIDIDRFKGFNDRYGHIAGDSCLKRVSAAIASELRDKEDLLVRYGGEEFVIVMPQTDLEQAVHIAERMRHRVEVLAIPHEGLGPQGIITASFGVMAGPKDAYAFGELVAAADAALYAAKRGGRNQSWPRFCEPRQVSPDYSLGR